MDLEIVPLICKPTKDESGAEIAPLFSGSVTIRVPSMPESYRFKAKYGKKTVGMQGIDEKTDQAFATMELLADIAEDIQPFFTKVELKEVKSKKAYKTVDELYTQESLFPVISEVAMKFITGFASKD